MTRTPLPAAARRAAALLALTAATGAGAAAPAQAEVKIGLADNKAIAYENAELRALGYEYARISVRYDAYRYKSTRERFLRTYEAAARSGKKPLVVFQGSPRGFPTPGRLRQAVRGFMRLRVDAPKHRSPREFSLYNEPNHEGWYKRRPERLGEAYLLAVRETRRCGSCTILGGDLLDTRTGTYAVDRYARAVERGFRRAANGATRIRYWGLHNYSDANTFRPTRSTATRKLLRAVRGKVWLTETGGVFDRPAKNKRSIRFSSRFGGTGDRFQYKATSHLFTRIVSPYRKRIERVYVYQGIGGGRGEWDSGLISSTGQQRSTYDYLMRFTQGGTRY